MTLTSDSLPTDRRRRRPSGYLDYPLQAPPASGPVSLADDWSSLQQPLAQPSPNGVFTRGPEPVNHLPMPVFPTHQQRCQRLCPTERYAANCPDPSTLILSNFATSLASQTAASATRRYPTPPPTSGPDSSLIVGLPLPGVPMSDIYIPDLPLPDLLTLCLDIPAPPAPLALSPAPSLSTLPEPPHYTQVSGLNVYPTTPVRLPVLFPPSMGMVLQNQVRNGDDDSVKFAGTLDDIFLSSDDDETPRAGDTLGAETGSLRHLYQSPLGEPRNYMSSIASPESISSPVGTAAFTHGYPAGASQYPDSSSDYSTATSDLDSLAGDVNAAMTASACSVGRCDPTCWSIMGHFNTKLKDVDKKHECKVCEKRFTRPSSLRTHIYSHTGEKPFTCRVHGCGRDFSVESNLRRHQKVHKSRSHMGPDGRRTGHQPSARK